MLRRIEKSYQNHQKLYKPNNFMWNWKREPMRMRNCRERKMNAVYTRDLSYERAWSYPNSFEAYTELVSLLDGKTWLLLEHVVKNSLSYEHTNTLTRSSHTTVHIIAISFPLLGWRLRINSFASTFWREWARSHTVRTFKIIYPTFFSLVFFSRVCRFCWSFLLFRSTPVR